MTLKISRNIFKQDFLLLLLIAGILMPDGITEIAPFIGNIWGMWRWGACVGVFLYWLYTIIIKKKKYFSKGTILFVLFFAYIIIITFLKNGSMIYVLSTYLPIISCLFFYEICKKDLLHFWRISQTYLFILAILNLLLLIVYPEGMYISSSLMGYTKNWLFGYKSSFQFYLYPLFFIELFEWKYSNNRRKSLFIFIIVLLESYLCGNIMLLITCSVVLIFVVFNLVEKNIVFNQWTYGIVVILLNWFFLSLRFRNSALILVISNYFHKNADLTGRTAIWYRTYLDIASNFFTGNGMTSPDIRKEMYQGIVHAHNAFLEIMYEGGLIWVVFFIVALVYIFSQIYKYKELDSSKIYAVGIFGILIMGVFEIITHRLDAFIWVLMLSACDSRYIAECYSCQKKKRNSPLFKWKF